MNRISDQRQKVVYELLLGYPVVVVAIDLVEDVLDLRLLAPLEDSLQSLLVQVPALARVPVVKSLSQGVPHEQLLPAINRRLELAEVDFPGFVLVDLVEDEGNLLLGAVAVVHDIGVLQLVELDSAVVVVIELVEESRQLLTLVLRYLLERQVGLYHRYKVVLPLNHKK